MLVIVADDRNVVADMFFQSGIDAGTCSDVFLSQCTVVPQSGERM